MAQQLIVLEGETDTIPLAKVHPNDFIVCRFIRVGTPDWMHFYFPYQLPDGKYNLLTMTGYNKFFPSDYTTFAEMMTAAKNSLEADGTTKSLEVFRFDSYEELIEYIHGNYDY